MRKVVLLIFTLMLINCSKTDENLAGEWYFKHTDIYSNEGWSHISFKEDQRFFISNLFSDTLTGTWKFKGDSITVDVTENIQANFNYGYKINGENLYLSIYNRLNDEKVENHFIKSNSQFDYLEKFMDIKINLPESEESLMDLSNQKFNYYIYCNQTGQNNLQLKTLISSELVEIRDEFSTYIKKQRPEFSERIRIVFVADKEVKDKSLKSIKDSISNNSEYQFFRVYKSKLGDHRNLKYFGKLL